MHTTSDSEWDEMHHKPTFTHLISLLSKFFGNSSTSLHFIHFNLLFVSSWCVLIFFVRFKSILIMVILIWAANEKSKTMTWNRGYLKINSQLNTTRSSWADACLFNNTSTYLHEMRARSLSIAHTNTQLTRTIFYLPWREIARVVIFAIIMLISFFCSFF